MAALGAGIQAWEDVKNKEKCQAITREFVNRRLMRKSRIKRSQCGKSPDVEGGGNKSPPIENDVIV